jgi:hypothetical protein
VVRHIRRSIFPIFFPASVLLVFIVAGIGIPFLGEKVASYRFQVEDDAILAMIESWRRRGPNDIDQDYWEEACNTLYNVTASVCYTPSCVSLEEMERLRAEVEERDKQAITLDTLRWYWYRLGRTGPHGAENIRVMQPIWNEIEYVIAHPDEVNFNTPR